MGRRNTRSDIGHPPDVYSPVNLVEFKFADSGRDNPRQLLRDIARQMGVASSRKPELADLSRDVAPEKSAR